MSVHSEQAILDMEALLEIAGENVVVGVTTYSGIVSEIPYDTQLVPGGTTEAQQFTVKLRLSDFAAGSPAQFTAVTARGKSLIVLSSTRNNGHLEIICGSTANQ